MTLPKWALAFGAVTGGAMVLLSVLWTDDEPLEAGSPVAAIVNGQPIPVADVEIALEAMARDSRNALPEDSSQRALDRLIDEELLFQRAIDLDLPRNASTVRRTIVMTMIDLAQSNADLTPDEQDLRALFENNPEFFAAENRYRIRWESAASPEASRARPAAHPPDRMLTATDLRRYLGESLTASVLPLRAGEQIGPVENGGRFHWLSVIEFSAAGQPEFETHRDRVEALWQERAAEAALEAYIAELRREADIRIQPFSSE